MIACVETKCKATVAHIAGKCVLRAEQVRAKCKAPLAYIASQCVSRALQVRRISRRVLPHSTHGRLGADDEKAVRSELEAALRYAKGAEKSTLQAQSDRSYV